jgi:serine/threonine protein kinase
VNINRPLERGDVIGGRYRVEGPLGQGGMAWVYLALDLTNESEVALKIMRPELAGDPDFIRRFATEARAAASLDHPNIVRVLDYGQDGDIRYIVQEYIEGRTLKDLIEEQGSLDYHLATPLAIQIALALEHAHQREVIHRDIKPQNILITNDMVAKVTDFGIARASSANTITLTGGMVMGSVHYFSPEQARGGVITLRSDLYSLGIVFYEMLTGRVPFDGESSVAVAIKHLQEIATPPTHYRPNLPVALDHIVARAIAKNPDVRYPSARAFVNELDAFMVEPNGVYGVIPRSAQQYETGTSAIGVQKQESNFSKIRDIERTYNQRRSSRYRDTVMVIGIVAIAVILLSVIAFWLIRNFGSSGETNDPVDVVIPNFVGQLYSEAQPQLRRLEELGILPSPIYQENDDLLPNVIFRQLPESDGTLKVKPPQTLQLYISRSADAVTVPNVQNETKENAERKLREAKLVPNFRLEASRTVPKDQVIRTVPAAGALINSGAPVEVYISSGAGRVLVPNITGRSLQEASTVLRTAGLRIGNIQYVGGRQVAEASAYVLNQDIAPNTEVDTNSTIPVLVGTEQDLYYYRNPTQAPPESFSMPAFVGTYGRNAEASLAALGFHGKITARQLPGVTINFSDEAAVIASQDPAPGTKVSPSGNIVFQYGTQQDYEYFLNPTPIPTPTSEQTLPPETEAPPAPPTPEVTAEEPTAEVPPEGDG